MESIKKDYNKEEENGDSFSFNSNDKNILEYWDKNKIFEKSLALNKDKPLWTFLDGPPFVNGTPHSGHVLVSYVKDTVIRFKSMEGYYVPRTIGFDCHGLPLEQEAEKIIGKTNKDDIMEFGIANYNNVCRDIIAKCSNEWENCFHKLGRWVDFEKQYKTMDKNFMESEWWAFKVLFEKGLVYKGFKIMPYSNACTTALSNFEANSNYKEVIDMSATVTFPIINNERFNNTSFLAWTTTPWTLPSNLALCVNPNMVYLKIWDKKKEHFFIIAQDLIKSVYSISKKNKVDDNYRIEESFIGSDLVGIKYEPLFQYFSNNKYFSVLADDFVKSNNDDKNGCGTGIVHIAPAFGADDFRVCVDNDVVTKKGERLVCPLDESGNYTNEVSHFKGRYVKDCDRDIIKDLKCRNRLFSQEPYRHNYPHCWRTDTPLIYKCIDAWFINVEAIKDDLVANNMKTNWVPNHVKEARFHNWLTSAQDWCVSRSRYWGTPIPIWMSDDGEEILCIGSIEELEAETGLSNFNDLHKEFIDDLQIPSKEGRGMLKKIPDVFDCWYESGLCGLASQHYPFENKEFFENHFPIDFISESLDQTRGWFYTLMVLSTALFNKPAFKNVIVTGLILASDGKKMSKRLKNYTDPMELIDRFGSDPLRLYLISAPVVRAEPFSFQDKGVQQVIRKLSPWYNGFKFFTQCYTRYNKVFPEKKILYTTHEVNFTNVMDIWIDEKLNSLVKVVRKEMSEFKLYKILDKLLEFIDQLTNWYIKLNRDRLKGIYQNDTVENWEHSLKTLYNVLYKFSIVMAPFTPFFCEYLYLELSKYQPSILRKESVHLYSYPEIEESKEGDIERQMDNIQKTIDITRKLKLSNKINLSMPVKKVIVAHNSKVFRDDVSFLKDYLISEANIIDLEVDEISKYATFEIVPNKSTIGRKFRKESGKVVQLINQTSLENINNLTFNDIKITEDYYSIVPKVNEDIEFEYSLDNNILVLLDKTEDENVITLNNINKFKREIQNLRKDIGLQMWDKIKIYYHEVDSELGNIIANNQDTLRKMIIYDILPISHKNENRQLVTRELQVNQHKITVTLVDI